jgi:hypothetical protein
MVFVAHALVAGRRTAVHLADAHLAAKLASAANTMLSELIGPHVNFVGCQNQNPDEVFAWPQFGVGFRFSQCARFRMSASLRLKSAPREATDFQAIRAGTSRRLAQRTR